MTRAFVMLLAAGLLVFAGCSDTGPSTARIRAKNYREFMWWRSEVARDVPPQRWAEFNGALDEIRYELMAQKISGAEAIGEALAARVNGRSVDEVLRLGDELKLARLEAIRDELKEIIDGNALLGTKADDAASREVLERRTTEQRDRLAGVIRQLREAEQQYAAHGGQLGGQGGLELVPKALTREEALRDFSRIVGQRLHNAALMYGDWPARIDRSGRDLPPELAQEFADRRDRAQATGHTVIPVHIRARWRLFDDVVRPPEFSPAVTGQLTAADRRDLQRAWADSEAEIWARREAMKDPAETVIANMKEQMKAVLRPK